MKLAIMQPYFLPYIGYFQLLNLVDKFVFYDDVNFINRGWINRNNMLVNGQEHLFTIPLVKASQNKLIKNIEINNCSDWRSKTLKTIRLSYSKAPNFDSVYPIFESIFNFQTNSLPDFILNANLRLIAFLSIDTEIIQSSSHYLNNGLKGQERILDICIKEQATMYVNPPGGKALYEQNEFVRRGIELKFLNVLPIEYKQYGKKFTPYLSILDVLMFNGLPEIKKLLNCYSLV
ncbi:WbqC family protein [Thalassotalea sediminis]|uniref:WbqC family protein n=1 Tax=Thalassotalea sediminis TaxID=1759089 RepID=UPI002574850B|nr:WbqC family protein [Thalassotalea sediminis]